MTTLRSSSDKELASIWPKLTEDEEKDLDSIPPLRFTVVQIPIAHVYGSDGPPSFHYHRMGRHHLHRGDKSLRFGGGPPQPWFASNDDGEEPEDPKEPGKPEDPNEHGKPESNLRKDVNAFIEAVKANVTDNKQVKDAFKKVMAHAHSEHKQDSKEPADDENEQTNLFTMIDQETPLESDGLTGGIVAALLTPVFNGSFDHPHGRRGKHGSRVPPPPSHGGPGRFPHHHDHAHDDHHEPDDRFPFPHKHGERRGFPLGPPEHGRHGEDFPPPPGFPHHRESSRFPPHHRSSPFGHGGRHHHEGPPPTVTVNFMVPPPFFRHDSHPRHGPRFGGPFRRGGEQCGRGRHGGVHCAHPHHHFNHHPHHLPGFPGSGPGHERHPYPPHGGTGGGRHGGRYGRGRHHKTGGPPYYGVDEFDEEPSTATEESSSGSESESDNENEAGYRSGYTGRRGGKHAAESNTHSYGRQTARNDGPGYSLDDYPHHRGMKSHPLVGHPHAHSHLHGPGRKHSMPPPFGAFQSEHTFNDRKHRHCDMPPPPPPFFYGSHAPTIQEETYHRRGHGHGHRGRQNGEERSRSRL